MPFLNQPSTQIALSKAIGQDDLGAAPEAEFKEQLRAAYRLENTIGSFFAKNGDLPDSVVTNPNFNPIDFLTEDEKLDSRFMDNVMLADNTDEIESLRDQMARETEDRNTLAQGGFIATGLASLADPINFIPVGGTAYKTYRTGSSILTAGLVTAGAAATSTAATEAGLHYSQIQRTYGESAINITAATFLGGVLGASPAAVRKLLSDAGHDPDKALADIERTFSPEQIISEGGNPSLSVGAAKVLDDIRVRGILPDKLEALPAKLAKAIGIKSLDKTATEKFIRFVSFDPLMRTITSAEKATRILSTRLVENPVAMDRATSVSVESKIKLHDGKMFEGITAHNESFKAYKANGGVLSRREFNEAVGKAIRNGSDDPIIQKSADDWNKFVYEPLKKDAIAVKLLADDVEVTTAKNYLNRLWNKEKLAADLSGFNRITSGWLMKRNPDLELEDANVLAREIAGRIMSTPDGRLPYDYQLGENAAKGSRAAGVAGAFKKRSFDIDDTLVEEFLENDIELLAARYVKNVAPDIEIVKEFGDVNMTAELKTIEQNWTKRIEDATSQKEAKKLAKMREADIRDIAAMRDRMRGRFAISDSNNPWVRSARVARDLNYMRLLGGVVAASIPDVGRLIMAEGITNTFRHGLRPLVSNLSSFKMGARESKLYGIGTDALLGGRAEIIADVADYAKGGTAFERGVRSAATKFSSINLMNQWTGGIKQLHAVVVQTRITNDLLKGKYDKRLGQLGIDEADSKNIAQQLKKHAEEMDGVWVANTKNWDSPALVEMWRGAMRKESDRVIVMPGQEKPLFMSTELGKTIFQFKTFMFSSTQRVLISTLQNQDKHTFQGILAMTSLGAMSYAFKQWDAGREVTDDPKTLIIEGIDRSGTLGVLMEMNNTLEKVSANSLGLRPLIGISAPASRYASRSAVDSIVGPTFGLVGDAVKAMGAASNEFEWSDSDTRTFRRLIPGQNLSFLRQGFDVLEKEISSSLGAK